MPLYKKISGQFHVVRRCAQAQGSTWLNPLLRKSRRIFQQKSWLWHRKIKKCHIIFI